MKTVGTRRLLDDAFSSARAAASPWAAFALLGGLPVWLLLAQGLHLLADRAQPAPTDSFHQWGWLMMAALVPAAWGRLVWARAIKVALAGATPDRACLRTPPRQVAAAVALLAAVAGGFALLSVTFLPLIVLPWATGVAIAVVALDPLAGTRGGCGALFASLIPVRPWLGAAMVLLLATVVVGFNLWLFAYGVAWLAQDTLGIPAGRWTTLLGWRNPDAWITAGVGGLALVDPVLIAAAVAAGTHRRARASGSDLTAWLARLERRG